MYSFVLQDWTSLEGVGTVSVIQSEHDWLDMSPFQDVVLWIDVRQATTSPTPNLLIETSPSKDESLFVSMNSTAIPMTASPSPFILQLLMGSAAVPVAQYLRWKISSGGGTWEATFRILVAANAPGLQPDEDPALTLGLAR